MNSCYPLSCLWPHMILPFILRSFAKSGLQQTTLYSLFLCLCNIAPLCKLTLDISTLSQLLTTMSSFFCFENVAWTVKHLVMFSHYVLNVYCCTKEKSSNNILNLNKVINRIKWSTQQMQIHIMNSFCND